MINAQVICLECNCVVEFVEDSFVDCECGNVRLLYDNIGYSIQCKSIESMEYTIVEKAKGAREDT